MMIIIIKLIKRKNKKGYFSDRKIINRLKIMTVAGVFTFYFKLRPIGIEPVSCKEFMFE